MIMLTYMQLKRGVESCSINGEVSEEYELFEQMGSTESGVRDT